MLKLGEKIINKLYLGDKKIAKVFLGDKLVYQSQKITFLDYIIFDGASWIDTGIKPVFGDELEITAQIGEAVAGQNYVLFGTGTSSIQFTGLIESGRVFNRYFGTKAGTSVGHDTTTTSHTYLFKNDGSVYQNGKLITSPFTVTEATVNSNLTIGTRGYVTEYWLGNIYSVKLISANGTVKLDLRPCIHPNGTVCFYDLVTNKYFYNQGTGELKAGGRFVKSILFDGASYIDTGITHQTCTVECDIRFEETGTRQLMGFGTGTGQFWGAGATGIFDYMSGTNALDRTLVVINFDATEKTVTINADGKTRTGSKGSSLSSHSYKIGTAPTGATGGLYWCTCEVWGNKFTNADGELIQDLRPYVDADGKAYFKDLVTGDLFYGQGTGTLGYTE